MIVISFLYFLIKQSLFFVSKIEKIIVILNFFFEIFKSRSFDCNFKRCKTLFFKECFLSKKSIIIKKVQKTQERENLVLQGQ